MANRLHHIAIFVRDMDRALHLLDDLLGFTLVWRAQQVDVSKVSVMLGSSITEADLAYLEGRPDGTAIELICPTQPASDSNAMPYGRPGSGHLSLEVDDLDGLCLRLDKAGYVLLNPITTITTPGGDLKRICFFRAEDGLTIELIASQVYP